MIGEDFTFGGNSLSDFSLVMANPEKEEVSGLNREVLKGATTIYKYEAIHFGSKYSDVLTVPFFIIKDDCVDDNPKFTQDELRRVSSWLTYSKTPQTLTVSFDNSMPIELYGIFTEITPYIVDGLNGLYLTFTCTSPFALEENSLQFTNTESNYKRIFNCTTDEDTFVYPIIKIKPSTSGTFSICNQRENKTMSLTLDSTSAEYEIDCKRKRIVKRVTLGGTVTTTVLYMSDVGWTMSNIVDFNSVATGTVTLYWLRFSPGDNPLVINGAGDFEIICKSPIKVGGYPYD